MHLPTYPMTNDTPRRAIALAVREVFTDAARYHLRPVEIPLMRMPSPLRRPCRPMRHLLVVGILAIASTMAPVGAQKRARPDATALNPAATGGFSPRDTPLTLGAAAYAKILCSAVFVTGREEAEARRNAIRLCHPSRGTKH
ncbi:MAG: hypothetical protein H0V80_10270 [Acidobacteria bacterium]|nr:hypothetical protein [Acidobacteriota bacterium]